MGDMDDEDQIHLFNTCINSLESTIDVVNEYSDEKEKQMKYLKEVITKDYCSLDLEYERATNAINKLEEQINREDIDPSIDIEQLYADYLHKEKQTDHLTHPVWYRIVKCEKSVLEAMDVNESVDAGADEEYEAVGDGSLLCSQARGLSVDPLTKSAIKKPCKSSICGHIYDYDTIILHIKRKRKGAPCPYLGCTAFLTKKDISNIEE